jgi:hypothetical protein
MNTAPGPGARSARDGARAALEYRPQEGLDADGLTGEEIGTATGEQLGNFPQAYSHIGLITSAAQIDAAREL